MRLTRKYAKDPWEISRLHKIHQHNSVTSAWITIILSTELAKMKMTDFLSPTKFLDSFKSKLQKFNLISIGDMAPTMAIGFLKTATHGNTILRWINKYTVAKPNTRQIVHLYLQTGIRILWDYSYLVCVTRKDVHMFSDWVVGTITILSPAWLNTPV